MEASNHHVLWYSPYIEDVNHVSALQKSLLSLLKFDADGYKYFGEKKLIVNYERRLDFSEWDNCKISISLSERPWLAMLLMLIQ